MKPLPEAGEANGFTLSEIMITVVIVGILSAIALPNYFNQVQRTKQNEAVATLSQIQNTLAAYIDEFNRMPKGWKDLSDIAAIMTTKGPTSLTTFNKIILHGGNYSVSRTDSGKDINYFEFTATPTSGNIDIRKFNVMACLDLENGASDIKKGVVDSEGKGAVSDADLVCIGKN